MTDKQIIDYLKSGGTLHFSLNRQNTKVMDLMSRLEHEGKIETWGIIGLQNTRRGARWVN